MAIKIQGTTVVDDARGLTNVSSIDATTATSITNAGVGGGGEYDFVASGAISNGDVVSLNADGTVSVTSANGDVSSLGSETVFEAAVSSYTSSTFDSLNNKVIVAYRDEGNSNNGTVVVGTVNGTSISFGTPVSIGDAVSDTTLTFDSSSGKVILFYIDNAAPNYGYGTAIVGTVSGNSISFGSPVVFESDYASWISATFDSTNSKVIIAYRTNAASNYGVTKVGTVSGTSISFGSRVVFESALTDYIEATYDSYNQKVVIAYQDRGNSSYGTAVVGEVSGTSISFGTPVVFNTQTTTYPAITFDSSSNKVVIAYKGDSTGFDFGTAIVGTVSGTSISFGASSNFQTGLIRYTAITFDSNTGKVVISYDFNNDGYLVAGTVSGTSITFDAVETYTGGTSQDTSTTFDSNSNRVVTSFRAQNNSDYGTAVVYKPSSSNAASYVGVAAEDISNGSTGAVTILNGINERTVDNYNLSTASYDSVSFSVAGEETTPIGIAFKSDGTKMYILGDSGDDVNEYDLSTAWDVSTASYVQNFSVAAQETIPEGVFFKPDGTKMYVVGSSGDDVNEYSLSSAWDISTASYVQNFSVSAQETGPTDLYFKPDGTKMYISGRTGDAVYEYSLSTAWDISTASYVQNFSIASQENSVGGLFLKSDGTKMYVTGSQGDDVNEYSLSTAWNISTASYVQNFSVASQSSNPQSLHFESNGTKMYILCYNTQSVYQYSTGTFAGYTTNQSYFVADNGSLTTTNNGRKIGKAISQTQLQVKTKLTGDEMNAYLGSLV